jgi:hypothetical protein
MQPATVSTGLRLLYAFLRYLVDREVAHPDLLERKLRVKVPEALPRAIDPEDVQQFLAVIEKPRDRAMILVLLRAVPREAYLPDWLAVDWKTAGGRVCVCDEPIPDDWTYFEVLFSDVNFVAVSPVAGDSEELRRKHLLAAGRGQGREEAG